MREAALQFLAALLPGFLSCKLLWDIFGNFWFMGIWKLDHFCESGPEGGMWDFSPETSLIHEQLEGGSTLWYLVWWWVYVCNSM